MSVTKQISRDEYLAQAATFLRQKQPIPDYLLEKLGVGKRRFSGDSPDMDSHLDAMREHSQYLIRYRLLEDEIREKFDLVVN